MRAISDRLPNKRLNLISRSIFTLKHEETEIQRRSSAKKVLHDFHVDQLGHCFLVIATVDMVADVMGVVRASFAYGSRVYFRFTAIDPGNRPQQFPTRFFFKGQVPEDGPSG